RRAPTENPHPSLKTLLRVAFTHLLFLDKIPNYAAVNEAVQLAKAHGGKKVAGFANAVLRSFLRENVKTATAPATDDWQAILATEYSHPRWLVHKCLAYYDPQTTTPL